MPLHEAASKAEARAGVEAVFERYKKLAEERSKKGFPQVGGFQDVT